jgi:hypothetical protein
VPIRSALALLYRAVAGQTEAQRCAIPGSKPSSRPTQTLPSAATTTLTRPHAATLPSRSRTLSQSVPLKTQTLLRRRQRKAAARLDLEVPAGWASPSSRGLWGGDALALRGTQTRPEASPAQPLTDHTARRCVSFTEAQLTQPHRKAEAHADERVAAFAAALAHSVQEACRRHEALDVRLLALDARLREAAAAAAAAGAVSMHELEARVTLRTNSELQQLEAHLTAHFTARVRASTSRLTSTHTPGSFLRGVVGPAGTSTCPCVCWVVCRSYVPLLVYEGGTWKPSTSLSHITSRRHAAARRGRH